MFTGEPKVVISFAGSARFMREYLGTIAFQWGNPDLGWLDLTNAVRNDQHKKIANWTLQYMAAQDADKAS